MKNQTLLVIDCGTQSLRAMVFSLAGELRVLVREEYPACVSPRPGWAEQDPELYWECLTRACMRIKTDHPDLAGTIAGIGITSQRNSMINVDPNGRPLRPAILWMDQRKTAPTTGIIHTFRQGLSVFGPARKFMVLRSQGKCNWIRQNQPDIWKRTHKYLQISGFLNYRLTGVFADSVASQIGYVPFDYKKQAWAGRFKVSRMLFPVETEKLPALVLPGEVLGYVTARAGRAAGLPEGLPVISCGSDKGCETLGAGVTDSSMVSLSFGTTATVQTLSERYFEPIPRMPPYPSPVPGFYNPEIEIFRGFWMITWFKNELAHKEVEEARKKGIPAEEVLNRCLERTSPGAMGLVVQPYWAPGLELPHAKGAMIGFGDAHTRDHIYRAVIEGLGFAMFEGLERIQRRGRLDILKAAVSGGASQSDEICKITADIFNLPMIKGQTHETSGLGAAIIVSRGLGLYSTLDEAIKNMVKIKTIFLPDPTHVAIYKELYSRVYKNMYNALGPLYAHIQQITGYPDRYQRSRI